MPTLYKPSQWRGKRLVYQSTDPDEPKRETARLIQAVFLMATLFILSLAVQLSLAK